MKIFHKRILGLGCPAFEKTNAIRRRLGLVHFGELPTGTPRTRTLQFRALFEPGRGSSSVLLAFAHKLQLAELRYLAESAAGSTMMAENYIGLSG